MFNYLKDPAFKLAKDQLKNLTLLLLPFFVLFFIYYSTEFHTSIVSNDLYQNPYHSYSFTNNHTSWLLIFISVFEMIAGIQIYKALVNKDFSGLNLGSSIENFVIVLLGNVALGVLYLVLMAIVFATLFIIPILSIGFPLLLISIPVLLLIILYGSIRLSYTRLIFIDLLVDFSGNYSEKKDLNFVDKIVFSLKESWRITSGQVLKIILLSLSLVGWIILVLITLGLAIFFVQPYILGIEMLLYKDLIDNANK